MYRYQRARMAASIAPQRNSMGMAMLMTQLSSAAKNVAWWRKNGGSNA